MDNNSKYGALTNFDTVWQRVTGKVSAPHASSPSRTVSKAVANADESVSNKESGRLLMFIKSEIYLIKTYDALVRHSSGPLRSDVQHLQNTSRFRLKALQAAYFLITGKNASPQVEIERFVSPANTLRSAYIAENSAETAYLSAAEQTEYPSLSDMYTAMSQSAHRSGKCIIPIAGKISSSTLNCRRRP